MKRLRTIFPMVFLLFSISAAAQFYVSEPEPSSIRWNHLKTDNYDIIFPRGMDSLAYAYGKTLEEVRADVGKSIGFLPNGAYKRQMPVILHTMNVQSNGSVAVTPRRISLYTIPSAYDRNPTPWMRSLIIHESRHAAQMELGKSLTKFKALRLFTGEIFDGALAGLYANSSLFEGDAVVAETALSNAGRGRSADFLEYYRMSFDNGDFRNIHKWRYGSIKRYTPDEYALGYISVGGFRYFYDAPLIDRQFYGYFFDGEHLPLPFALRQKVSKELTGKRKNKAFLDIEQNLDSIWKEEAAGREPFIQGIQFSRTPRRHTEYISNIPTSEGVISIKKGLDAIPALVLVKDDGEEKILENMTSRTSPVRLSEANDRLYWSEDIPDIRWQMKKTSSIRFYDLRTGKTSGLTKDGNYFYPTPSPDGKTLAVSEYHSDGSTALTILNAFSGKVLRTFDAPDSLQLTETAIIGENIFAAGISEGGNSIYKLENGRFIPILRPQPVSIKQLDSREGKLLFVSDRTGVNELYSLDPDSATLCQLSSTRYGTSDAGFSPDGETFFYSSLSPQGRLLYRVDSDSLRCETVDFNEIHSYRIADKLSEQEASIKSVDTPLELNFSEVMPYNKALHLIHFHSWLPLFFSYDDISSTSSDLFYKSFNPGAVAFFQNDFGTAYGSIGYCYPNNAELKFTYSGLYPVIELDAQLGPGNATRYNIHRVDYEEMYTKSVNPRFRDKKLFKGSLKMYIPLDFSSGAWSRGLIPQINYSFSNSCFDTSEIKFKGLSSEKKTLELFDGYTQGAAVPFHSILMSIRGYSILRKTVSQVYPRLGLGFEAGYHLRFALKDYASPVLFTYLYGYLPGIIPQHGIKLTAKAQSTDNTNAYIHEYCLNPFPRGLSSTLPLSLCSHYRRQYAVTGEYAMAIAPVDFNLFSFAYIRNFELTLHADCSVLCQPGLSDAESLSSVGFSLAAVNEKFCWLPFEIKLGLTYSYNGGSMFRSGIVDPDRRNYLGLVFSVDI